MDVGPLAAPDDVGGGLAADGSLLPFGILSALESAGSLLIVEAVVAVVVLVVTAVVALVVVVAAGVLSPGAAAAAAEAVVVLLSAAAVVVVALWLRSAVGATIPAAAAAARCCKLGMVFAAQNRKAWDVLSRAAVKDISSQPIISVVAFPSAVMAMVALPLLLLLLVVVEEAPFESPATRFVGIPTGRKKRVPNSVTMVATISVVNFILSNL